MKLRFLRYCFLSALIAATAGCGGDPVENLLRDPGFETIKDTRTSAWSFIQHAGERSYDWDAEDGVLTGRRVGPETDGHIAQTIAAQDLAGKKLRFSVEISGELEELLDDHNELSGLQVHIHGVAPGMPRAMGPGTLLALEGSPPVNAGKFGWMTQEAVFDVPQGATSMEMSIRLGMNGSLRIRNPVLAVHSSSR
ncbi:MAG TPA: hypothetical protein VJ908_02465 [Wenzhouxiangellaceae bacterium]|nr:hypothetical protein [Wenzhouxiangellaceae bacterium]